MSPNGFHPFGGAISSRFGNRLAPDDAYLSYYDVRLTKEDVDCIRSGWLTDNGIAFWQEYLEHDKLRAYPTAQINLLRPSMAFMIIQTADPTTLREALPSFRRSTHIFLPINDSSSPNLPEGGSHWSLLLVSLIDNVAFHYDSLFPANANPAATACHKFSQLLQRPLQFINLQDTPQQENGSDCGVFVCLVMRYLVFNRLLRRDATEQVSMSMRGMEVDANRGRREITKLIEAFRKEGKSASRSPSRGGLGSAHGQDERSYSRSPPRVGD